MIRAAVLILALSGPCLADPVIASPRPEPRPDLARVAAAVSAQTLARSLRPRDRPIAPRTADPVPVRPVSEQRVGPICGDRRIQGVRITPLLDELPGCAVAEPVQVISVDGITLSTPSFMDCPTAQALSAWVRDGVAPAIGRRGGGLAQIQVAAHFVCRTRNGQKGGKISEHGKGRAIDISAFVLKNGESISVLEGWGHAWQGRILRRMHKAACGPFSTVLGPDSDRFHRDHFHLDTAPNRRRAFCR